MLYVVLPSAVFLTIAYFTYGRWLARALRLDATAVTPAHQFRDDLDYAPCDAGPLLSQHFSAIAAAGPIVGPILAGLAFGWVPALCWILVGCVFVGGVHDMTALVASIRHRARSIAEVVRDHMSRRAFLLFLSFVWLALVYIIIAFTDITAGAFVKDLALGGEHADVKGAGIASSSIMYLCLPIIMGLLMRFAKLPLGWATVIFLPLVGVAIWAGQSLPVDVAAMWRSIDPKLDAKQAELYAHKTWDVMLLAYCCIASVTPLWLLLQPRGHLGGYFLYAALFGGAAGLLLSNSPIQYPAFNGWVGKNGDAILPMLFITIACGACSGFHALIASGTTSKQLRVETDARPIGYGAMLLEGMVAIVSLCCVMRLAPTDPALVNAKPDFIYALGIGSFLESLGMPGRLGVCFAMMAFTTFVYDTLDVCTRLGRYIVQELTGWQDAKGKWLGTLLTAGVPAFFVTQTVVNDKGNPVALWSVFWKLFGASNQLLAALTLLGITVWLWRTRRERWVWIVTGIPTVLMYAMSSWALGNTILATLAKIRAAERPAVVDCAILGISSLLVLLSILMLIEAALALAKRDSTSPAQTVPATT